jgi:molybdenum cofactor cytidylyltransferase
VLLAAGGATRFRDSAARIGISAAHKLLAPLHDRTVFAWSLGNVIEAGFSRIVVVRGAVPLPLPAQNELSANQSLVVVDNPDWEQGQATSLACAIDHLSAISAPEISAMVVGLGDQPFIPAQDWISVVQMPEQAAIVVATYAGQRRNPVRIARELWEHIPRTGDEGARPLLRLRPDLVSEVACTGNPADIDTAEDLLKWS